MEDQVLSVAEASDLTGKARSTITRAIKAGKLPNNQLDDTGAYTVHMHDLIAAHMLDTVTKQPSAVHQKQIDALVRERDELPREVDRLTRENRELGQANIDLKEWISDLRQQRDLISNNTAALAALQEAVLPLALPAATQSSSTNADGDQSSPDAATAAGPGRKKGLFRRLIKRGIDYRRLYLDTATERNRLMRVNKSALMVLVSVSTIGALTACNTSSDQAEPAVTTSTATVFVEEPATTHDEAANLIAEATQPDPEPACGQLDANQALQENISQVPTTDQFAQQAPGAPGVPWDTNYPGVDTFDPCADLAAITVGIENGTGSSPYQIMLFHRGDYLGTATKKAHGFSPTVTRVDDSTLEVTWHYALPGESNAARSGEAVATFTWNSELEKVDMNGEEPPAS